MFRSGSTLLEQVLAAHPDVGAGGELELLPRMVLDELAPFPSSVIALDEARCAKLARDYHARMLAGLSGEMRCLRYASDKRPDNYLLIGLIKRLIVHCRIVERRADCGRYARSSRPETRCTCSISIPALALMHAALPASAIISGST